MMAILPKLISKFIEITMKFQVTENMQITYLIKELYVDYIKNSDNEIIKRQITQLKSGHSLNRHFPKEDIQLAKKNMKKFSILLVIFRCK